MWNRHRLLQPVLNFCGADVFEEVFKRRLRHYSIGRSVRGSEIVCKCDGCYSCENEEDDMGAPLGLFLTQSLASDITHFLSTCVKASTLFEMMKGVLSRWSAKWWVIFHTIDSDPLLAVDCLATGLVIKKSKIMQGFWFWGVCHQTSRSRHHLWLLL